MARGVFEDLVRREGSEDEITADFIGTHAFFHLGGPPDSRARGLDIGSRRARMLESEECGAFDYVLVMDRGNYENVRDLCRGDADRVRFLLDYAPDLAEIEVPNPYHGGSRGFGSVMELVEDACRRLLEDTRWRHPESRV